MEGGGVISPLIIPGWDHFTIQDHLEKLWNIPITLNNDAELGALGEWAYNAGRSECYLINVKVGYGIGAGLLINGQIYRGATSGAGEVGHITIHENGPVCTCDNRGCLDAMAGGRSIVNQARKAVQLNQRTQLASIHTEQITALHIAEAAQQGDLVSHEFVAHAEKYIGIAFASLINILNPGMIIIGGRISLMGDFFLEPTRQTATGRSLSASGQNIRITTAYLGKRSSALSAISQALSLSTL